MTIMYAITKKEIKDLMELKKFSKTDPCFTSCDADRRQTCCGCPKFFEWQKQYKALESKCDIKEGYSCTMTYVDKLMELEEVETEIEKLKDRKSTLIQEKLLLEDRLIIYDDTEGN